MISFRPDDDALLARLEEEVAAGHFWRAVSTPDFPQPPRLAGIFAALGVERSEAIAAVEAGRTESFLARLVDGASTGTLPAAAIHAAAVLFERLAPLPRFAGTDRGRALELASLRAWCRLTEKPDLLRGIAEAAAGEDAAKIDLEILIQDLPFHTLEAIEKRALIGARERTAASRSALQLLGTAASLENNRYGRRAKIAIDRILDEATAAPLEAIHEAKAQESDKLAEDALMALAAVWQWADRPLVLETQTLEMADHFLWAWNKADGKGPLKERTMRNLAPLVDSLATRIERDSTEMFAWSALCAQSLIFLSDDLLTQGDRVAAAERAVRVCPTHRNARSRLAFHRADAALTRIARNTRDGLEEADRLLADGERLFPASPTVRNARERWEAAALRLGVSRKSPT